MTLGGDVRERERERALGSVYLCAVSNSFGVWEDRFLVLVGFYSLSSFVEGRTHRSLSLKEKPNHTFSL